MKVNPNSIEALRRYNDAKRYNECPRCGSTEKRPDRSQCRPCWLAKKRGRDRSKEYRAMGRPARPSWYCKLLAIGRGYGLAIEAKRKARTVRPRRDPHERDRQYQAERRRTPEGLARRALQHAVEAGVVNKPDNCEMCGKRTSRRALHGHHHDYSKALDVQWVCAPCHAKIDKRYGSQRAA